jgi:hypothetical protein
MASTLASGGRPDRKLRRRIPIAALYRVTRRAHGQRIRPGNERLTHLLDDRLRLRILSQLQIGIDEVIHCVQLVVSFVAGLGSPRRFGVGADRFLPVADAVKI